MNNPQYWRSGVPTHRTLKKRIEMCTSPRLRKAATTFFAPGVGVVCQGRLVKVLAPGASYLLVKHSFVCDCLRSLIHIQKCVAETDNTRRNQ